MVPHRTLLLLLLPRFLLGDGGGIVGGRVLCGMNLNLLHAVYAARLKNNATEIQAVSLTFPSYRSGSQY